MQHSLEVGPAAPKPFETNTVQDNSNKNNNSASEVGKATSDAAGKPEEAKSDKVEGEGQKKKAESGEPL